MKYLKVYSSETAMVMPCHGGGNVHGQQRRVIGRKFNPKAGIWNQKENKFMGQFELMTEPDEIPYMDDNGRVVFPEYKKKVLDGDLIPADEATAKLLDVPFNKQGNN